MWNHRSLKHVTCISTSRNIYYTTRFTYSTKWNLDAAKLSTDEIQRKKEIKLKKKLLKQQQLEAAQRKAYEAREKQKLTERYNVDTPPGEKKDVTVPLPASYSPQFTEAAWYAWWEKQGFFSPDYRKNEERFVTCLPPPNVTGSLHLGHALGTSIQDAIVRWHRMSGREVLWNPGCDHAGIATQVVVEKKLWREQKKSRHDLGRERFIEEVWKWKDEKGIEIYDQMKKLGLSLDWKRAVFTLDPKLSYAVNEAFIRLHEEGLIYRSKRMVNWSCALKSTISDIEVDNIEIEGKTFLSVPGHDKKVAFGVMTHFAYPVKDSEEEIVVATTRPETMLGDTAVAVHPDDRRYTHLHGKHVIHPLIDGRTMPIVCDEFVKMDKGTGAVKITPCHDPDDYEVGIRHKLDFIDILDDSGNLINVNKPYFGLSRFEARRRVIEELKSKGLYRDEKSHVMTVPICSRSSDIIEPRLKDQWYVDLKDMSAQAAKVVETGELEIIPSQYKTAWFEWLSRTQDWCLSRQLWWGHRVPVYRVEFIKDSRSMLKTLKEADFWISAHSVTEALHKASAKFGVSVEDIEVTQDEDVLDTWFSSALYPFSIFGWPEQTDELSRFYPSNLLETGSDIMFFWVARMVMMGQKLTGKLPFKQVLFHSILRDAHGRKMSKSLGNVIDPMHVISGRSLEDLQKSLENSNLDEKEIDKVQAGQKKDFPLGIPECGADALRFTLASYNYKAYFSNVDVNHIKTNRNFCNKIRQAYRFVEGELLNENHQPPKAEMLYAKTTYEKASNTDLWILSRLSHVVEVCDTSFKNYSLNEATQALYQFWRAEFCDVYLEYSKRALKDGNTTTANVLYLCMHTGLRLLSPFMPFITEELFQRLPREDDVVSICLAPYPECKQYDWRNEEVENEMLQVQAVISRVLSLRKDFNLTKAKPPVFIKTAREDVISAIQNHHSAVETLARSSEVQLIRPEDPDPDGCCDVSTEDGETRVFLEIIGHVDAEQTRSMLEKQMNNCEKELKQCEAHINSLLNSTKEHVLLTERQKLKDLNLNLLRITNALSIFKKLKS